LSLLNLLINAPAAATTVVVVLLRVDSSPTCEATPEEAIPSLALLRLQLLQLINVKLAVGVEKEEEEGGEVEAVSHRWNRRSYGCWGWGVWALAGNLSRAEAREAWRVRCRCHLGEYPVDAEEGWRGCLHALVVSRPISRGDTLRHLTGERAGERRAGSGHMGRAGRRMTSVCVRKGREGGREEWK